MAPILNAPVKRRRDNRRPYKSRQNRPACRNADRNAGLEPRRPYDARPAIEYVVSDIARAEGL